LKQQQLQQMMMVCMHFEKAKSLFLIEIHFILEFLATAPLVIDIYQKDQFFCN